MQTHAYIYKHKYTHTHTHKQHCTKYGGTTTCDTV